MNNHDEHKIQAAAIAQLRLILQRYGNPPLFAIPNGGNRDARTGAILKREGVVAGVPDLFLARSNGCCIGLFVEVKTQTGRLSASQRQMQERLKREGYVVAVCRSTQEIIDTVVDYLKDKMKEM